MAQPFIKQVMESMGWSDGTNIPVANAENRKLLNAINDYLKEKAEKAAALEAANSRVESLLTYCTNSEGNLAQNVKLIGAHRSQLSDETHLSKLAEHEDYKYRNLLQDLEKDHVETKKFEENTSREIARIRKAIEKLSGKIDWAKQALIEWRQAMTKGEEANNLIEKFCKEDQGNVNKLENRRRMIQDTTNKRKKELVDMYEEQKSIEQSLERTAQLYRQAHAERRQLIKTWRDAVDQMTQREDDIRRSETELEEAKKLTVLKQAKLKEEEDFMKQQIVNNKEVQAVIDDLNEELSTVKMRLVEMTDMNALKANEVQTIQRELASMMQKLQQQRQRNKTAATDKIRAEHMAKDAERQLGVLEARLKKFQDDNISSVERLAQLDELLEGEEKIKHQLNQETIRVNGIFYRSQEQLGNLRNEEKILKIQNNGAESALVNMKKSIKDDEKELIRRIEASYGLGCKVQQLEMKIARLEGSQKDIDPEKEARMVVLEKRHEGLQKQLNLLQTQVGQIEDDMRKLTSSYNNDLHEVEKMSFMIKEKETLFDGGNKKLKELTTSNQERLVELSILKMRISQMERQISKHDDKLYSLEKHRMELEKTISEQMINVRGQFDLLHLKKKHLMDERATLRADVADRRMRIETMKKRHDLAIDMLGKNDDGSVVTVTQLRIEAAQEKQMLLHEGNELNEKVLKAEKDIKAMENTLCLINYSNDAFRKSFGQCDDDNPQLAELDELKKAYCDVASKIRFYRGSIEQKEIQVDQAIQKRDCLERELDDLNRNRMDNNDVLIKVHKELMDQKMKLQRAERELKTAQKAGRQRCNDVDYFAQFERELDLREIEEKNTTALQLLADLVDVSPDLAPTVSTLLYEKGMKIPQVKRMKASSSYRSECSGRSMRSMSETSLQIFSASSKASTMTRCSPASSTSSKAIGKSVGSAHPSVVSLEFPGECTSSNSKICHRSQNSLFSKKYI